MSSCSGLSAADNASRLMADPQGPGAGSGRVPVADYPHGTNRLPCSHVPGVRRRRGPSLEALHLASSVAGCSGNRQRTKGRWVLASGRKVPTRISRNSEEAGPQAQGVARLPAEKCQKTDGGARRGGRARVSVGRSTESGTKRRFGTRTRDALPLTKPGVVRDRSSRLCKNAPLLGSPYCWVHQAGFTAMRTSRFRASPVRCNECWSTDPLVKKAG